MSATVTARPTESTIAFRTTMERYLECKFNPRNPAGFNTPLERSLRSTDRKVRVSPSDYVADVELAARRALRDFPAEYGVFRRIYLDMDDAYKATFSAFAGKDTYDLLVAEIENRVGGELISSGIYPLRKYTAVVDVR